MYKTKNIRGRVLCYLLTSLGLCLLFLSCRTAKKIVPAPEPKEKSIVILFENDVHCAIDGYAKLAGLKAAVADTSYAQMVSCGDFIQGGTIGSISKGQYIIDVLRKMDYDAITLGNHEFDFKSPHLFSLMKGIEDKVTCVNYIETATGKPVFNDFIIKEVGNKKIAYIGVTTPTTLSTMPMAFTDEEGAKVYDLLATNLYDYVQHAADHARRSGANYVIVLSHLGEKDNEFDVTSHALVAATRGIDAVLDGHSHSVVKARMVKNLDGIEVPISQTGTLFENIGKLVIMPDGKISVSLPKVKNITAVDETVLAEVERVKAESDKKTSQVVAKSDVDLLLRNQEGLQITRICESNTGDLVTDAYRITTGADIGLLNAGAIRNALNAGDLTYGNLISLLPYDNWMCVAEVTGADIVNMLKVNTAFLPRPDGQFPAVSGMHYTVDINTHELSNVEVLNKETGAFEPIVLDKVYTIASTDYAICNGGFRGTLKNAKILRKGFISYCDAFVDYIVNYLNGHITEQYAKPEGRITVLGFEDMLKGLKKESE